MRNGECLRIELLIPIRYLASCTFYHDRDPVTTRYHQKVKASHYSQVLLVPEADKTFHMCVDYRASQLLT